MRNEGVENGKYILLRVFVRNIQSTEYIWKTLKFYVYVNMFNMSSQNSEVSVFEVNIRFIGGLLAAYYLSGEEVSHSLFGGKGL